MKITTKIKVTCFVTTEICSNIICLYKLFGKLKSSLFFDETKIVFLYNLKYSVGTQLFT